MVFWVWPYCLTSTSSHKYFSKFIFLPCMVEACVGCNEDLWWGFWHSLQAAVCWYKVSVWWLPPWCNTAHPSIHTTPRRHAEHPGNNTRNRYGYTQHPRRRGRKMLRERRMQRLCVGWMDGYSRSYLVHNNLHSITLRPQQKLPRLMLHSPAVTTNIVDYLQRGRALLQHFERFTDLVIADLSNHVYRNNAIGGYIDINFHILNLCLLPTYSQSPYRKFHRLNKYFIFCIQYKLIRILLIRIPV